MLHHRRYRVSNLNYRLAESANKNPCDCPLYPAPLGFFCLLIRKYRLSDSPPSVSPVADPHGLPRVTRSIRVGGSQAIENVFQQTLVLI